MSDSDWAIPTDYMNDIREVEKQLYIDELLCVCKAMLPISGSPEQKALWLKELEEISASVSNRLDRRKG